MTGRLKHQNYRFQPSTRLVFKTKNKSIFIFILSYFFFSSQTVDIEENETNNAVNQDLKVNKLSCYVVLFFGICIMLYRFIFTFV